MTTTNSFAQLDDNGKVVDGTGGPRPEGKKSNFEDDKFSFTNPYEGAVNDGEQ